MSPFPRNLPTQYPDPLGPLPAVRVGSKYDQVRVSSQTGLQFRRLPVRPGHWAGPSHSRPVGNPLEKVEVHKGSQQLYGQTVHVPDRPTYSSRKTGQFRSPSYEAHSMALEETLARPTSIRESYPGPAVTPSSSGLVARRDQGVDRSAVAPPSAPCSILYRRLKQRLGCTLSGLHCKRRLVPYGKSPSHKLSRTESSPSGIKTVRASVQRPICSCCNRQHDSGLLHKQARGYEVRLSLCPPVEAPVLVPSQRNCSESKAHSRSLECDSGQAFQAQSSDPNRVVPLSAGVQSLVFQVGPAPKVDLFATRFNYKLPKFVSPVPDPTAWAVDALSLQLDHLEGYAFHPVSLIP